MGSLPLITKALFPNCQTVVSYAFGSAAASLGRYSGSYKPFPRTHQGLNVTSEWCLYSTCSRRRSILAYDPVVFAKRLEDLIIARNLIMPGLLEREHELLTKKWFDYRFLSPLDATLLFGEIYRKALALPAVSIFAVITGSVASTERAMVVCRCSSGCAAAPDDRGPIPVRCPVTSQRHAPTADRYGAASPAPRRRRRLPYSSRLHFEPASGRPAGQHLADVGRAKTNARRGGDREGLKRTAHRSAPLPKDWFEVWIAQAFGLSLLPVILAQLPAGR